MARRLVLGCGPVGRIVVAAVDRWRDDVVVVSDDEDHVETFRDEGVVATYGDPTDPTNYPEGVEMVFVAGGDARGRAAATAARERFPDAFLVAYAGRTPGDETLAVLDDVADRVVDPQRALVDRVTDLATGNGAKRVHDLLRTLRGLDGPLAVVMHDNPDPDAIAAAIALAQVAESVGVAADACYYGSISHQENRALVNLLELDLRNFEAEEDVSEYAGVALVDHSRPGVNDGLPEDTHVDIVIDHHPPRAPIEADFVDLRHDVGATSTLLVDYLERLELQPTERVASALLYGIRIDTKDFTREASDVDFEAAAHLVSHVDWKTLDRIESPSVSPEVLRTTARAIHNRTVRGEVLATNVGIIRDRDSLAQAADLLLDMEGVRVTLVYGVIDDVVYVSGRARGTSLDLGETLRDALDAIGSAGGHADMAGAQIPLGIIGEMEDEEERSDEEITRRVSEVIETRVFETMEETPVTQLGVTDEWNFAFDFPVDW